MVLDILLLEIHLSREAIQLPFHLRADAAVQGDTPIPECMVRQLADGNGVYRGFGIFIIRHGWSCIARIVGDG